MLHGWGRLGFAPWLEVGKGILHGWGRLGYAKCKIFSPTNPLLWLPSVMSNNTATKFSLVQKSTIICWGILPDVDHLFLLPADLLLDSDVILLSVCDFCCNSLGGYT